MTAKLISVLRRLSRCERGASALEYAFVAVLISIAAIAAFQALGTSVQNVYNGLSSDVANATS